MLKFSKYNKGISTPILLSIVVLSAVILGGLIMFLQYPQTDEIDKKTDLRQTDQTGIETQTQTEVGLDEMLTKIKNNLKDIKTVHATINKDYNTTSEHFRVATSYEYDFIFPNKKQQFFVDYPISEGEAAATVIDNNIYLNLKPVGYSLWFLGKDGQRSVPFFDAPIDFNLTDYPEAWDFTNYAEAIEENLGIEKINGVECYHYKMIFKKSPGSYEELKKIDNHFSKNVIGDSDSYPKYETIETTDIEQKENKIKFFDNNKGNKEIIIPVPGAELINFPFEYINIEKIKFSGDAKTLSMLSFSHNYSIKTKGIEGEIWVGKDDLLVYKENYIIENTRFSFNPHFYDEKIINGRMSNYNRKVYEVVYSNFNKDITIEHPLTENVITTIEQYLERAGLTQQKEQEPYNEEQARDARRKADIRQINTALEMFYADIGEYGQIGGTATMPSCISGYMDEIPKDPLSGESYGWIDNTKDSSKFCIYAKLEQGRYYACSHKERKALDSPPTTLSCW